MQTQESQAGQRAEPCRIEDQPVLLTDDQQAALQRYANQHGRQWKSRLSADWAAGRDARGDDGALLRQVRNQLGPEWLYSAQNAIRPNSPH